VTSPLRGQEIDACIHQIALSRTEPFSSQRSPGSPEQDRRRNEAEELRRFVLGELKKLHPDAVTSSGHQHTEELITAGCPLILQPRLADTEARRTTSVNAFIRVGRTNDKFLYAPLVIKNHELTEPSTARHLVEGSFEKILPTEARDVDGLGLRSTATVRRDALLLCGALRILQSYGAADESCRGAVIDRQKRLWWLDLTSEALPKSNLSAYDALFEERRGVLEDLDSWLDLGGTFPTSPYWHRDCLNCQFAEHCEKELDERDDVSLTRFTSREQQAVLRAHGIETRRQLAGLRPLVAQQAKRNTSLSEDAELEERLAVSIERLDVLIYRARAHVAGSSLRIVPADQLTCPRADVEIDVDMESYSDATYLWGAYVTVRVPTEGVTEGYRAFVEWGELNDESEAKIFADFWQWLSEIRKTCSEQGRSLAAYCFWAQAENEAMMRAVRSPLPGGPRMEDLSSFWSEQPAQWIDLHEQAKNQIQTEGPLGLKLLATATGFSWRDENPSGEASMTWYEEAVRSESSEAMASRTRILEYNEDDCRATLALREWLCGPAKLLAHRDDTF
jgi:predicted RecB family nuclease